MKKLTFTITILLLTCSIYATRIVSLSPAITEVIFALGEGDKMVGNTRFCDYPAEAMKKSKIGGYLDMNIELIASLNPEIVFHYPEHLTKLKPIASRFRLVNLTHSNISSIYESIMKISTVLNISERGEELVKSIKAKLHKISSCPKIRKPKVLMIAGRNPEKLDRMYIVGNGDFLNELLEIAGGTNAYTGNIQYPSVSIESIMRMKPDYIIDLAVMNRNIPREDVFKLWQKFRIISTDPEKKILIIKHNFWVRPGPRIAKIAETMYNFIQAK